jgi:hypothetical protein
MLTLVSNERVIANRFKRLKRSVRVPTNRKLIKTVN